MVPNAAHLLAHYLDTNTTTRREWDKSQKLKADLRVTKFGRRLRKASMDELPLLWNVFVDDMSLVWGPSNDA